MMDQMKNNCVKTDFIVKSSCSEFFGQLLFHLSIL